MVKNSSSQKCSALIIITSIISLILVGGLGYVFWNNTKRPKSVEETQTVTQVSSESPVTSSLKEDGNILKIEDWKIEFTIPGSLKDTSIKYFERKSNDTPSMESYVFTTSRIQELGGECTKSPFGDTVQLSRFTEDPGPHPHSLWVSPSRVDGYIYILTTGIAGCSMFNEEGQMGNPVSQTELDDRSALVELAKTLKSSE
jgi:hypothetical protein